jgi:hypothetical protein
MLSEVTHEAYTTFQMDAQLREIYKKHHKELMDGFNSEDAVESEPGCSVAGCLVQAWGADNHSRPVGLK